MSEDLYVIATKERDFYVKVLFPEYSNPSIDSLVHSSKEATLLERNLAERILKRYYEDEGQTLLYMFKVVYEPHILELPEDSVTTAYREAIEKGKKED